MYRVKADGLTFSRGAGGGRLAYVDYTRAIVVSFVSGGVTFVATPLVTYCLRESHFIDMPNGRSSHSAPTPRGGGLACVAGGLAALAVAGPSRSMTALVVAPAISLGVVGFVDDFAGLPAAFRLFSQVTVGSAAGALNAGFGGALAGGLMFPVVVNAVNFMDGVNGITAMTTSAWGLTTMFSSSPINRSEVSMFSGAVALGSSLGFLPWNAPRATVFLGDIGSYYFGALVAATSLNRASQSGEFRFDLAAKCLAPLAPYFADTGFTILKRARKGDSLIHAHREHIYQRLSDQEGWTHFRVALIYGLAAMCSGLAVLLRARFRHGKSAA